MKMLTIVFASLLVGACTAAQMNESTSTEVPPSPVVQEQAPAATPTSDAGEYADLPDFGKAPELENQVWLNTSQALRLEDLRGKVVLLDMWTFG